MPDGQVGEISFDLESARFGRVTLMVEMDRALDPVGIDPLSAIGIVFEANGLTDLIQLPLGAGSSKI